MSAPYAIWVVEFGYVDRYPASNLFLAQPNEGLRRMSYCFGVVRSESRCILVDTGYADQVQYDRIAKKYGGDTRFRSPLEMLARVGVRADEVDTILLTHSHFDHAGLVPAFENAHVYVQKREMDDFDTFAALGPKFEFLSRACQMDLPDMVDRAADLGNATVVDGELDVAPGIRLVPAHDTHTGGSQFVLVENADDGLWLFAGDNIYVYENLEGLHGDGVYAPIGMTTGGARTWLHTMDAAIDRVGGDINRVIPFHEPEIFSRFPSRTYEDGLHVAELSSPSGSLMPGPEREQVRNSAPA